MARVNLEKLYDLLPNSDAGYKTVGEISTVYSKATSESVPDKNMRSALLKLCESGRAEEGKANRASFGIGINYPGFRKASAYSRSPADSDAAVQEQEDARKVITSTPREIDSNREDVPF